jgi:hypothetical protein
MAEHLQRGVVERLHVRRFLRTSAQYFGLSLPEDQVSTQVGVSRKPLYPVYLPSYRRDSGMPLTRP